MKKLCGICVVVLMCINIASAATVRGIDIDFVHIGNVGNADDKVVMNDGTTGYGAVGYDYWIGKCEVTNAQWNAFVAAVGVPTGTDGGYGNSSTYTGVQQPANQVSWYEAAQFCNYLTSGNKSEGAYLFNGNNANPGDFLGIDRNAAVLAYDTAYVIPTEDEWYKAAYYTGSGYSSYANGTDTTPVAGVDSNYDNAIGTPWNVSTGTQEQNATFDMMGNVWEWNETLVNSSYRVIRGGSGDYTAALDSSYRNITHGPYINDSYIGFRVASVPEPCSMVLLGLGGLALLRKRRRQRVMLVSCFLFIAVAGTAFAEEPRYLLTDLGTTTGYAFGINDNGQVVGSSGAHAFLWSDGVLTDLGIAGESASVAYGINNNGQVVGESELDHDGSVVHTAVLWEGGEYTELAPLQGQIGSRGNGINADGLVVGHSRPAGIVGTRACQWPGGALDPPGTSYSYAWSVNDAGDVVGEWDGLAVLWRQESMVHLGTLEGGWSIARDVNNSGQVVGESDGLAFLWQNESMSNLGLLPGHQHSEASAINDTGQIVGRSHTSSWPNDHAVLWEDGQIQDLNALIDADSGWLLAQARDINQDGDIVGWGYVGNEQRAYLLTVIPEPCTVFLLGFGGLGLLRKRRMLK